MQVSSVTQTPQSSPQEAFIYRSEDPTSSNLWQRVQNFFQNRKPFVVLVTILPLAFGIGAGLGLMSEGNETQKKIGCGIAYGIMGVYVLAIGISYCVVICLGNRRIRRLQENV